MPEKKDYPAMQESMIYEESPSFDRLIETSSALNRRINAFRKYIIDYQKKYIKKL